MSDMIPAPRGQQPDTPNSARRNWSVCILLVLSACVAGFFLPIESPFQYQYKSGKPWKYRTLKAPFDFEVMRPTDDTQREAIRKIATEQRPYFLLKPEIARLQKKQLAQLIHEQTTISSQDAQYRDLVTNSGAYLAYGSKMLDILYNRGVVEPRTIKDTLIFVVNGNDERLVTFDSLFTLSTARNFLTDSLPFSPLRQPELLLPILEKLLVVNTLYSDSLSFVIKKKKIAEISGTGVSIKKGDIIVEQYAMLTPETIQKLDSLSARYELPDIILIRIGYGMLALLLTGFLFFGLYLYYPEYWNTPKYLIGLPGIILLLLLLIYGCYALGIAVPLVLPLFLVPLMLKPYTGQRLGIAVWSIPVLLVAFALDWGGVWLIMQAVAVGIALFLNDGIQTWKHRGKALAAIVLAQAWVWGAAVLAERLPEDLQHTDVLFFLALAAVLSLGQSVLLRFVKI